MQLTERPAAASVGRAGSVGASLAADTGPRRVAPDFTLERRPYGWCGLFRAMASPCEVHVSGAGRARAAGIVETVRAEAARIEAKFSRYLEGNAVDRINRAGGEPVRVDDETARLLDYAAELHALSDGRFDITSGVLRRAWTFDGGDIVPGSEAIDALRERVGWDRVEWRNPVLRMPAGMEIDLGGIGKEYAVDLAAQRVGAKLEHGMINFGGDLVTLGPLVDRGPKGEGWTVGIESLAGAGAMRRISLSAGALATSGDTRRYVMRNGRRYGHILDARTGWPVEGAPRSVTVLAPSCTQAGMLATFAMLMGAEAESFLEAQQVRYWCLR